MALIRALPPLPCLTCHSPSLSPSAVASAVGQVTTTPSTLRTGSVPAMTLIFRPRLAMVGGGRLMLAVSSMGALANGNVFAAAAPADSTVVVLGLANCTNAIGVINGPNRTLTITLPSDCVLAANTSVTVEIHSGFFAPNPAAGTTVVLSLATSADTEPLAAPGYTIGMCGYGACISIPFCLKVRMCKKR